MRHWLSYFLFLVTLAYTSAGFCSFVDTATLDPAIQLIDELQSDINTGDSSDSDSLWLHPDDSHLGRIPDTGNKLAFFPSSFIQRQTCYFIWPQAPPQKSFS
ncbi:hypothetical protein OLMES_1780 [Oleiphilus messinensis]|uniref:Secreted protein n=1 Tax=Oleiphilus messinensis TaxID=141451 RepID=A0A1Y0I8P7_9GAMM|nr:hypothetical protein [Oleiphilus messinensis]ARU55855.1 hypothetical protein OLMES_1780 [Oleiphilus messinensis]